jgi:hypothetical protein
MNHTQTPRNYESFPVDNTIIFTVKPGIYRVTRVINYHRVKALQDPDPKNTYSKTASVPSYGHVLVAAYWHNL